MALPPKDAAKPVGETLAITVRLALISRQLFRLIPLTCRSSRSQDIELLVLLQEVSILRRQVNRPRIRREERTVLSLLPRLRPARDVVISHPQTVASIRIDFGCA
jgi:hypothetical protein